MTPPSQPTSPRDQRHLFEKLSKVATADLDTFLGRLRREKSFLERVFNALTEGVVVASPDLRVLALNDEARRLLGLGEKRKALGARLLEIVDLPELRSLVLRIDPSSRERLEEEIPLPPAPGSREPRALRVTVSHLPGDEESLGGILFILADATDRLRLEERRRHAEKLASLATLTAGIAHEVKNPLNSMSIHAQLLKKRAEAAERDGEESIPTEEVRGAVDVILEEMARLGDIVNEFLQAVRPTVPWMEPRPLNEALRRVAELARPECERRGIALRLSLDPEMKLAQFDERQLGQAVLNLLKNGAEAIESRLEKAANEKTEDPELLRGRMEVVLRTRLRGDRAHISVSDTGEGIREEDYQRIFEPYYTTKFHGTGLGLMNVYRIVREHGGEMALESVFGEGTTFTIAIPLRAPLPPREIGYEGGKGEARGEGAERKE